MVTQCEMILRYMRDTGSITPWEAMREFGCMRLGARIYDLKGRGISIITETVTERNRYGKRVAYARYRVAQ